MLLIKVLKLVSYKKNNPAQLLNRLTNPQISHRWGSEVRNSPLVGSPHPKG